LARRGERWGIAVTQSFLDTFSVKIGDTLELGPVDAVITARLDSLPDRIGTPGAFGPEAVVALEAMESAGRLTPGQLFRSSVRILFNPGQRFETAEADFNETFPDSGSRLRGPEDAVDGLQNLLKTLNSFLDVIGITALVAGGVGGAQATAAFLEEQARKAVKHAHPSFRCCLVRDVACGLAHAYFCSAARASASRRSAGRPRSVACLSQVSVTPCVAARKRATSSSGRVVIVLPGRARTMVSVASAAASQASPAMLAATMPELASKIWRRSAGRPS
jgi:hypothetical protein